MDHVAICVGRLSAQMEHFWLFHDASSDHVEVSRAHLIDILSALTTSENAPDVLENRINAKLAHAALLTRAAFSPDPKQSDWAKRHAEQQLRTCQNIALAPPTDPQDKPVSTQDRAEAAKTVNQQAIRVVK